MRREGGFVDIGDVRKLRISVIDPDGVRSRRRQNRAVWKIRSFVILLFIEIKIILFSRFAGVK